MRRREFIAGLGSSAIAWPLAARAQQSGRVRRIGVLMGYGETDPGPKSWFSGFTQGLAELGWTDGRNLRMDARWCGADLAQAQMFAKELVELQPNDPDRICECLGPGRRRFGCEPAASGRKYEPAVYYNTVFTIDGGLLCYGPDYTDIFHRSAFYIDRILRGAQPADLPVQPPVKFEMAVNVKTANALAAILILAGSAAFVRVRLIESGWMWTVSNW
jgi:hypothetical protein